MLIDALILFFTGVLLFAVGKKLNLIKEPIIEGLSNDSCNKAKEISNKNASNLVFLNGEIEKLKDLDVKMQTLNANVMSNNKAISGIAEENAKKAKEGEAKLNDV